MLIVRNPETDPYFNLAAEEYLLKEFDDDIFSLWRNNNAVVIGKHQNALAELNIDFILKNAIHVLRRLSGGGTVFHDLGNLNFTCISNALNTDEIKIDFKYFTAPVINALHSMGINATYSGRNDLLLEGMKISGNAEHIYHKKKRTMHHGTLLYNSRISDLSAALKVNPLLFQDKAVKSIRSKVTNISEHMTDKISVEEFQERIINYVASENPKAEFYEFTEKDKSTIRAIAEERYKSWDWNFGYSPKYSFNKYHPLGQDAIEVKLQVEKGYISEAELQSNSINIELLQKLSTGLKGQRHFPDSIKVLIEKTLSENTQGLKPEELLSAFF